MDWRLTLFAIIIILIGVTVAVLIEQKKKTAAKKAKGEILTLLCKDDMGLYQLISELGERYSKDDLNLYLIQLCATKLAGRRPAVLVPLQPRMFYITKRGREALPDQALGNEGGL